jgi:uncharacterized protein
MLSDHLCAVSWRARPGSFVSLMTLYESNYIRLGWLVSDVRALSAVSLSQVADDCDLRLALLERGPYTTTFKLTYLFADQGQVVEDPALEVRVYHDARLAEARGTLLRPAHTALRRIHDRTLADLSHRDGRWARNVMLNKWLEYCSDRGHRFTPAHA